MNDLPPESIELVRILAAVDVLFGPWPDSRENNRACFSIHERQRDYLEDRGLPWRVGGGGADRKAGERALGELKSEGLITLRKAARSHRCVGLTPTGDDHARTILGFHTVANSWPLFVALAESVERGPGHWATIGIVADAVDDCEEKAWAWLSPLLARGYLEAGMSSAGDDVFTVRPDQRKLATGTPPETLADPAPDQRFNAIFWAAYNAAEAEKLTWKPSQPNACYISILN